LLRKQQGLCTRAFPNLGAAKPKGANTTILIIVINDKGIIIILKALNLVKKKYILKLTT
jgi:hypothetical protein